MRFHLTILGCRLLIATGPDTEPAEVGTEWAINTSSSHDVAPVAEIVEPADFGFCTADATWPTEED